MLKKMRVNHGTGRTLKVKNANFIIITAALSTPPAYVNQVRMEVIKNE